MPFLAAEYRNNQFITQCCYMTQGYDIEEVKAAALSDIKHPACTACWKNEENNLISDRQLKNSAYDFYADKDIKIVYNENVKMEKPLKK